MAENGVASRRRRTQWSRRAKQNRADRFWAQSLTRTIGIDETVGEAEKSEYIS
ncbi:MAG: hypothetical protein ACLS4Z_09940 [Christensenellaceae bacterium]